MFLLTSSIAGIDPSQFAISHFFTISRPGQVHTCFLVAEEGTALRPRD